MKPLLVRAVDALQTGGWKRLKQRTGGYFQRRYFRIASHLQNIGVELTPLDIPKKAVCGCMYKARLRVANKSKIAWNQSGSNEPRFAVAAIAGDHNGFYLEGPHHVLPDNFQPGDTVEIDVVAEVPRKPGEYRLRVDLVRENCYWLSELGRNTQEWTLSVEPHSLPLFTSRLPAIDVTLDITNKCPLKCIQCRKTYFEVFEEQQDMNFPLFKKIAAEVFPCARSVSLSSAGEPLMTRNFMEAIELTRGYGVQEVSFITAGLHLNPARAEKLVDLGVTRVEFSIDGAGAEVYNKIRIGSNYDKVIRNIEYLRDFKRQKGTRFPMLRFNFVLMKSNIHELPDFIDLAARLEVEEVQTQHMIIFTDEVKDEALIFDKARSNHFIELAKKRAIYHGIRFFHPPLFDLGEAPVDQNRDMVDGKIWMEEDSYSFERKTHPVVKDGMQLCTDPWRKLYIDWQGLVFPCCVWKEEPLGDLRKNSFQEIWESSRYRTLREGLTTGKLGKSCAECSAITGGDINSERSYFF